MSSDFDKLNRLRVNAGKNPLKSWKGSQEALIGQITKFEADGFVDALPGAKIDAKPETTDPEIKSLLDPEGAMAKNIANTSEPDKPKTKGRASLARGLETDTMARNSRLAVQMQREGEKREAKAKKDAEPKVKLSKKEKRAIKEEAESRKKGNEPKGKVDAKKDPEKAKRQEKHIADKKAARAAKPAKEKDPDEVTVADLCRELGIDPKVGRAKLRRHEDKLAKLHTKGQDRWTFPKKAAADIKAILKGGK